MVRGIPTIVLCASGCLGQQVITTIAGTSWSFPSTPRHATDAPLADPRGVAFDGKGNLYVSDFLNHRVMQVAPDGTLTVFAGNGIQGYSGDGGPATSASLDIPMGLAADSMGNVYISDFGSEVIRRVSPAGTITTVAGNSLGLNSGDGGPATSAGLNSPEGIAVDRAGNLYIATVGAIRKVSPAGTITTVADNGPAGPFAPLTGLAIDNVDNLYIAGGPSQSIRKLSPSGVLTVIATDLFVLLPTATVVVLRPQGAVAVDSAGNLYVTTDVTITKISPGGAFSTVAGNGQSGFSGDGGPALEASLRFPSGVAVDSAGNLFITEYGTGRVRKVTVAGTITTVAGNGLYRFGADYEGAASTVFANESPTSITRDPAGNLYVIDNFRVRKITPGGAIETVAGSNNSGYTGDGLPAIFTKMGPKGVAVDAQGNLYIADNSNNRIRKVTPDGIVHTVAGNGSVVYSGDRGPAISAGIPNPVSITVDAGGNLYLAETFRIRKVDANGDITTVAGNGIQLLTGPVKQGNLGEGGPATSASLGGVTSLAVNAAGDLYLADAFSGLIRKISPAGIITTIAGMLNGSGVPGGYSGDGGPATRALLNLPMAVALDAAGNVFFADAGNNRIRKVDGAGTITTVAGNGSFAYYGDGGPAQLAALSFPEGIAVDPAGNTYIADTLNNRIREVLASAPTLTCSPRSLSFAGSAGGAPASSQALFISSSVPYISFTVSASTKDGANWLSADIVSGNTPRLVQITVDPSVLTSPGTYNGQIVITSTLATGSPIVIPVAFSVGPGLPPSLAVDQSNLLTFTFPAGASARSQVVRVRNAGGGILNFTVNVSADSPWLTVTPAAASATPAAPITLVVTADPTGLGAGTYSGSFTVAADSAITVPAIMNISSNPSALLLSQTGLSFTAVAQGGLVPPQNFGILNLGSVPLNIGVSATTLKAGNWLLPSLKTDDSGAQSIDLNVDPSQLAPDRYYGVVSVHSPGAANSPQVATAVLEVLPAGTPLGAALLPNELTFNAIAGPHSPSSQVVSVYNLTAKPVAFLASLSDPIVKIAPQNAVVAPDQPTQIVVQPFTAFLALPGTYHSSITLQFDDGNVRVVRLTIVVSATPGGVQAKQGVRDTAGFSCQPTELLPSVTSLGTGFAVPAGWPVAIQAQVQDDCGQPLQSGSVIAEFSNGDPPISMLPLPGGRWDGTWQTRANTNAVTVTVRAVSNDKQLAGVKQVAGAFGRNQQPPLISSVTNSAATNLPFQPLTPGGLITIAGSLLSDQTAQAPSVPFGTSLGSTRVVMAGREIPIALTDSGKVTAIIPYGIEVNTQQQLILQRADTLSLPRQINMAAASPAIFIAASGQGMIVDVNGNLVGPGNPAKSGDQITLYCTGLGELNQTVMAGDYGPSSSTTRIPVGVAIGGQSAAVAYSGLAPQLVGIYFVQVTVPDGVAAGDRVSVTLTSLTTPPAVSLTVTTSIAN